LNLIEIQKPSNIKWSDEKNYFTDTANINIEKNSIAFITGKLNDVFVLDIDIKDDGLLQWNNYLKTHIEPLTVTVKTPSGGLHYYFKYTGKKDSDNYLISNYLTTKTKYKGFGLDIRNNGGYVVFPPSKIDKIEYQFIRNFEEYDVIDMPTELIYWLLDGTNFDKNKTIKQIKNCKTNN